MPCRHLYGEKVRGSEGLPMHLEELRPAHAGLSALWRRLQVMTAQNVPHRDCIDGMPQVGERPYS
jgi:hypothetical protein